MFLSADRLTPALGAELTGFDPEAVLETSFVDELHAQLMEHHVIFLRDVDLSPVQMAELGKGLGTPVSYTHLTLPTIYSV